MTLLWPRYDPLVGILKEALIKTLDHYARDSARDGYKRWGIKHPVQKFSGFQSFLQLCRAAGCVFVYRNVFEVAPSAKARFPWRFATPEKFAELGRQWATNTMAMRKLRNERILHVENSDIVANPRAFAAALERHCSVAEIDPAIFQSRINVAPGLDRLSAEEATDQYRAPVHLTPAELDALRGAVKFHCKELGYEMR
jgi:hypothetical protein